MRGCEVIDVAPTIASLGSASSESGNLDLLRSIAVLFVVISHLPPAAALVDEYLGAERYHLQALGLTGVAIFFVHTCLVLMLSLDRQANAQGMQYFAVVFYLRRAFRIFPLSIVVVLVVALLIPVSIGRVVDWSVLLSNLFLVQNITGAPSIPPPLWSLPYEVQMYVLLPGIFIFLKASKSSKFKGALILWFASVMLVLMAWRSGYNYHLIKFFPMFLAGVLAFALRERDKYLLPWVFFAGVLTAGLAMPVAVANGFREVPALWLLCLALGLAIPKTIEIVPGILRSAGHLIAKYSYGIYLVHLPIIEYAFVHGQLENPALEWFLFLFGTAAISFAAFHLVERPGIKLGVRFAREFVRIRKGHGKAQHRATVLD